VHIRYQGNCFHTISSRTGEFTGTWNRRVIQHYQTKKKSCSFGRLYVRVDIKWLSLNDNIARIIVAWKSDSWSLANTPLAYYFITATHNADAWECRYRALAWLMCESVRLEDCVAWLNSGLTEMGHSFKFNSFKSNGLSIVIGWCTKQA